MSHSVSPSGEASECDREESARVAAFNNNKLSVRSHRSVFAMDADKEIASLKKDKTKTRLKGNRKELAEVCNYLGSKLSERGRFEEALDEHKEELKLCENLNDVAGTALAYRCIGECYSEMENYKKALENLKMYLEMASDMEDYVELQRAWATLGRTYFMKSDLESAEKAHNMALKFTEK